MNILIEKLEKNKTPFLQEYESLQINNLENHINEDPFDMVIKSYQNQTPLSNIDKIYKL